MITDNFRLIWYSVMSWFANFKSYFSVCVRLNRVSDLEGDELSGFYCIKCIWFELYASDLQMRTVLSFFSAEHDITFKKLFPQIINSNYCSYTISPSPAREQGGDPEQDSFHSSNSAIHRSHKPNYLACESQTLINKPII